MYIEILFLLGSKLSEKSQNALILTLTADTLQEKQGAVFVRCCRVLKNRSGRPFQQFS